MALTSLPAASRGTRSRRRSAAAIGSWLEDGGAASGREPTEQELLAAVTSLCEDQLVPYGRIVRKRLAELAIGIDEKAFVNMDMSHLRLLCDKCSKLDVKPEGEADWSATTLDTSASFIDIYSSTDNYSEEFWSTAAAYFESLGEDEMNCPGGRYECAKNLVALNLSFLVPYSLGQVCHIVQIAMTQRKLLGYRSGAIVPYNLSQTMVKQQCAEQNLLCRKAKMPLATWDVLRHSLWTMLANTAPEGLPLSNVKRLLRADFQVDLSETALGHATVSDLFKDIRLQDLCRVRLFDNGYFVLPALPQVTLASAQDPMEPAGMVNLGSRQTQDEIVPLPAFCESSLFYWQPFQPSGLFSTAPGQPRSVTAPMSGLEVSGIVACEHRDQLEQRPAGTSETAAWDLMCDALEISSSSTFAATMHRHDEVPPPQGALCSGLGALDLVSTRSESTCAFATAPILSTAPPASPFLHNGLIFPSLVRKVAAGSDAGSSLNTTVQDHNGSCRSEIDSVEANSRNSSSPPSPHVPFAATPSPWVQYGETFSQQLLAAADVDDDTDPFACLPPVDNSVVGHESFHRTISTPATPAIFFVAETPSPRCERNFSQLLWADASLDVHALAIEFSPTTHGASHTQNAQHRQQRNCTDETAAASGTAGARKQMKMAIDRELDVIATIELKVAAGEETLSKTELEKLAGKSDLLMEADILAHFSFDGDQEPVVSLPKLEKEQFVDSLWKVLPPSKQGLDGSPAGTTVKNTFIEVTSQPSPSSSPRRSSKSVPRSVGGRCSRSLN